MMRSALHPLDRVRVRVRARVRVRVRARNARARERELLAPLLLEVLLEGGAARAQRSPPGQG